MSYDLKPVRVPRIAGGPLRIFASLLENRFFKALLIPKLFKDAGFTRLRTLDPDDEPTLQPRRIPAGSNTKNIPALTRSDLEKISEADSPKTSGFAFPTIADYARAYRTGETTPEKIAQNIIAAIKASQAKNPPMRAIITWSEDDIINQARESTRRFQNGAPLSFLDGVPIAVKDELNQTPFPTTVGTAFLGKTPAGSDATTVNRLRNAGALLIGKTNMHEIGIGVTGHNPHHGTPRNPYNSGHFTGGSSSGSAAAVAAGLCPAALGADGGGSIRIPAALCGVVGLKATFGRVSEVGAAPLCWSVAHVGPLAATVKDAALLYGIIAGEDPEDPQTHNQPPVHLTETSNQDLRGLVFGVYEPWFKDATPEIVAACEKALDIMRDKGAKIQSVEIPNLDELRIAHTVSISSEMATAMDPYYKKYRKTFGPDVRTNLALAKNFTSVDYIKAQRIRTKFIHFFEDLLLKVDAILTPTTGITAPPILNNGLKGESDLSVLTEIMRFVTVGNLTGLPAISFPVGYDSSGLPIGMQAMGRHWDEALLLRLAGAVESDIARTAPQTFFNPLAD